MEKRCAVEKEDYDLAEKKKQQMEAYRLKVYQQLALHDLLDAELMVGTVIPNRRLYHVGVVNRSGKPTKINSENKSCYTGIL